MTKKLIAVLLILGFFLPTVIFAQTTTNLTGAGILPDNPLYFLKIGWENIVTFFTLNPIKKVEKLLLYGERRLAEAQKMIEKGKTKYIDKLMENYQKHIDKAMEIIKKQEEQGKDIEAQMQKVLSATSKHIQVLNRVLNQAPEAAKKGIQNAISASQKGYQQAIQSISKKGFKNLKLQLPKRKKK